MKKPSFKIKKLAHVCLGTQQLEKQIQFYCETLGCRIIHEFINPQGERYGAFLLVHQGTFVEFFNDPKLDSNSRVAQRLRHLCFEVDDIQAAAEFFKQKGFQPEVVRGKTDKTLQFWIEDPDLNRVEFHQYDSQCVQHPHRL